MHYILDLPYTYIFVIGGRGTGKTYGVLRDMLDRQTKFILMRRTQAQVDMINKPEFSPFRPHMLDDTNLHIGSGPISRYSSGFYFQDTDGEKWVNSGNPIGYTCALSTIANMRGFDASDVTYLIYDEFIPERHERPIRHEGDAFLNAYETINRNREILGREPLKAVLLSNANDLSSPLLEGLNLIDAVDKMCRKGRCIYTDDKRGIAIIMLNDSPISARKSDTALYKMASTGRFVSMALGNQFSDNDMSCIASRPLPEFRPVVVYDDICIYKHKSENTWYVCKTISGSPKRYQATVTDRLQFRRMYPGLWFAHLSGAVTFADYYCKNRFEGVYTG